MSKVQGRTEGTINIDVWPSVCTITDPISRFAAEEISAACRYRVDGADYMPMVRSGQWDGYRRLYHKGTRSFPAGLLGRVVAKLWELGHPTTLNRSDYSFSRRDYVDGTVEPGLWPFQVDVMGDAIAAQRCMLQVATGGGKTVIAGHIIAGLGIDTVFLVHTKDLLYQAVREFSRMLGEESVGMVGDGRVEPKRVTVCTIQTAARSLSVSGPVSCDEDDVWDDPDTPASEVVVRMLQNAGVVFMDECHRVAAPTALDVMAAISGAKYRFGLSASPWRDDGADLALEGAFGKIAVQVSASELIRMGYLVKPLIRMFGVPPAGYPRGARYETVYSNYIVNNDQRNSLGVKAAVSMVRRGRLVLVLVRRINHGRVIARRIAADAGIQVPFLSGVDSAKKRVGVLDDLRGGRLSAVVATTIADEGLDIRPLSGLVLLGGGKSSVRALQRVGRVLRSFPGKRDAEVVDFVDNAKFLLDHSHRRETLYQMEPEWEVTDI